MTTINAIHKKVSLILFLLLLSGSIANPQSLEHYKKGTQFLKADPSYGKLTDWETLFYDTFKSFCKGPHGEIYVANNRQHNIYLFTPEGKLLKTFAQKGEGPGDLYYPTMAGILDGKYLVIDEYGLRRRISLFDLSGKFVKILRTSQSTHNVVPLKNNRIAYGTPIFDKHGKNTTYKITIIDAISNAEIPVISLPSPEDCYIMIAVQDSISVGDNKGHIVFNRTKDGNLLVGQSNTQEIQIFSPDGKKINSFNLKMKPIPVTSDYIKKAKEFMIKSWTKRKLEPQYIKVMRNTSFEQFYNPYFPYYMDILVDEAGNILVFPWDDCITHCPIYFRVYTPKGEFVCETTLDKGIFDFVINYKFRNLIFSEKAIYGLFQLKNSDDISLRVVKLNW